jgi:hypothetical protein
MDTKLNAVERYEHAWRVWRIARMPEIAARRPELRFVVPDLPRGSIRLALEGPMVKHTVGLTVPQPLLARADEEIE